MGIIPSTPDIIPQPFANAGQRNVIEDTSSTPGAPNATWEQGFPQITMQNKQAGGKPPLGMDMNGVLYQLSQNAFFSQSGGVYPWNAELNYLGGAHVMGSDGHEYQAVQPSGPDVPSGSGYAGAQNPVDDTTQTYWTLADATSKANVDLDNLTTAGKAAMAHAAMPSGQSVDMTLPASGGTVTAPADGWMEFSAARQTANVFAYIRLINSATGMQANADKAQNSGGATGITVILPVSANDVMTVSYDSINTSTATLKFFYANGSAPTA